jgi:YegS/Rv2252/BmrU family lipid kinase
MKKALIIVNPATGPEALDELREELHNHFRGAGIAWELYETRPDVPAGDVVRGRLGQGLDLVVAAGGDGTVAAAIDGLAGRAVPLGIVPLGTGNLVARELDIPLAVSDAVALLAGAPRPRRIDALRVNGRAYVLNASVGISATIMGDTSREEKHLLGPMAYVGTGIWRAPACRPERMEVVVDGQSRAFLAMDVAVINCGILTRTIYPHVADARVDDGALDVLVLRVRGLLDYPRYFLDLLLRRPATPLASYLRARRQVTIRTRRPAAVQADGDIIGETPVTIEVLPSAVTILVPDRSPIPVR